VLVAWDQINRHQWCIFFCGKHQRCIDKPASRFGSERGIYDDESLARAVLSARCNSVLARTSCRLIRLLRRARPHPQLMIEASH
jgi:hypothetical protein